MSHPAASVVAMVVAAVSTLVLTADAPTWTDKASAISAIVAAGAAVVALVVAGLAANFAWGQLKETRKQLEETRRLQRLAAQPSVVLFARPLELDGIWIELVLRNYGPTGAYDVRVEITPPLQQVDPDTNEGEDVGLPPSWPFLAPGQEWRTFWDNSELRSTTNLPDHHDAVIKYRDAEGAELTTPVVLDFRQFRERTWIVEATAPQARKALVDLAAVIKKWPTK